ncbi:MAG: hypothetical protein DRP65_06085 [Planctomycetota bacterium]|nr:MAG: hypothetical protein DRP65_06085 [Planctomycetota bacterium]
MTNIFSFLATPVITKTKYKKINYYYLTYTGWYCEALFGVVAQPLTQQRFTLESPARLPVDNLLPSLLVVGFFVGGLVAHAPPPVSIWF